MKILYAEDYESMSRKAANIISAVVILKPNAVLGLATGSSPLATYRQLIKWYEKGDLDFSECKSVNLDEYVGLSPDNCQSYAYFMRKNFFDLINIKPENTHIPCGTANDFDAECRHYDEIIKGLGGIDIQLLGVGQNGHIGFNEPGSAFETGTHKVNLKQDTIEANSRFFKTKDEVPTAALTMGIKNIMAAKKILLLAYGEKKADAIYNTVLRKVEPGVPASILQLHNDITIIADKDALSRIIKEAPHLITGLKN